MKSTVILLFACVVALFGHAGAAPVGSSARDALTAPSVSLEENRYDGLIAELKNENDEPMNLELKGTVFFYITSCDFG